MVVIALGVVLFGGGSGHKYNLLFQNASQLVPDNQVLIGGQPVGSVESIELTENNLAEVKISVEQELHEGSTAVIRATSLSGVANHYVSIEPGPDNNPPLADDATLGLAETTTPADLDQLFNSFPDRVRHGLANFIQGQAAFYAGRGKDANVAAKFFAPSLNRTNAFVGELNADQRLFEQFVVNSGKLSTAVAQRGNELSSAVSNASNAFAAIAHQNVAFDQTLRLLPPVFRQSNTTFVNLRAALDDLDPLVETAKPATKNLAPFLANLRPVIQKAVPLFKNLRLTVRRPGKANDAGRTARRPARRPAARRQGVPALRTGDRRLPAQPQLRPRLHAGHLQRLRQARPDHRLLRRQRPLRADLLLQPQHLQLLRRRTGADLAEPAVRNPRLRRNGQAPLPGRRHAARPRRLQPLRRTAVRRLRRDLVPVQPGDAP